MGIITSIPEKGVADGAATPFSLYLYHKKTDMQKLFLLILLLTIHTSVTYAQFCHTRQGSQLYYKISGPALPEPRTDTIFVEEVTKENNVLVVRQKGDVLLQYNDVPTTSPSTLSYVYKNHITYRVLLDEYEQNRLFHSLATHTYREEVSDSIRFTRKEYQKKWKDMYTKGSLYIPLHAACRKGDAIPETQSTIRMKGMKLRMKTSGTYEGTETLTTPIGTLQCLKVTYTLKIKMLLSTQTMRASEWYAEGIGMVKRNILNKEGKSILTFELQKIKMP